MLRRLREVEVVVRRQARAARRAREHDPLQVGGRPLAADELAIGEQLAERLRREPALQVRRAARSSTGASARSRPSSRASVARRSRSTSSASQRAALPRASSTLKALTSAPAAWAPNAADSTRVVPLPANGSQTTWPGRTCRRRNASTSCGHELPEVRVQRVHVARALVLGQLLLGPRELAVDVAGAVEPVVDRRLRRHPRPTLAARPDAPSAGRLAYGTSRRRGRASGRTSSSTLPHDAQAATCTSSSSAHRRLAAHRARLAEHAEQLVERRPASAPAQRSQDTSHHSLRNTPTTLPSTSTCSG